MATKSGMDYAKIQSLIDDLETKRTNIIDNLTELSNTAPTNIATHYSGQAADTFKNSLTKVISNVSETLGAMIQDLSTKTTEKQTEYSEQDTKMQDSATLSN